MGYFGKGLTPATVRTSPAKDVDEEMPWKSLDVALIDLESFEKSQYTPQDKADKCVLELKKCARESALQKSKVTDQVINIRSFLALRFVNNPQH